MISKEHKVKNILCFLIILFGEDENIMPRIMNFSPDYLIEKWERYMDESSDASDYGLHINLRAGLFDKYFEAWGIK